jgi:mRNA interferase RelE/StbE
VLRIDISRQAGRFLKRLPPKQGRQLAVKIMLFGENPMAHDSVRMKGSASVYRRTDVGEYRIIYQVAGDILKVVLIGKRNDNEVYRKLQRRLK